MKFEAQSDPNKIELNHSQIKKKKNKYFEQLISNCISYISEASHLLERSIFRVVEEEEKMKRKKSDRQNS